MAQVKKVAHIIDEGVIVPKKAGITADILGSELTITTSDGDALVIDVVTLSGEMQLHLMLHGAKQKIVDAAAIPRNTETGASATLAEKFVAMQEVQTRLMAGEWLKVREAGTGGSGSDSLLVRALVAYSDKDVPAVREYLAGKSKAEKAALSNITAIAAIIARIRAAAQSTNGIDAAALLQELA